MFFKVSKTILNIPASRPNYAQIAITNICNLDCKMCFRNFLKLKIKHMDFDDFKKVVNNLEGVSTLALTGYGEPLAYPKFFEAVRYCKAKGFKVQTTSNGLLLNKERLAELMSSGLDSISISIESIKGEKDNIHPNSDALNNVRDIIQLKKELKSKKPAVVLQTLMIRGMEQELYDIIEWGGINGVDRINVARFELNTLKDVKRPDVVEEKKIFKEFNRLRRTHNIQIDCIQDQMGVGITGFLYKNFKNFLRMNKSCVRLYDFIYINVDGDVNPCCAIVDYKIGNMCNDNLQQIWKSEKYDYFRKNYDKFSWCSRCDFAKLNQAKIVDA